MQRKEEVLATHVAHQRQTVAPAQIPSQVSVAATSAEEANAVAPKDRRRDAHSAAVTAGAAGAAAATSCPTPSANPRKTTGPVNHKL